VLLSEGTVEFISYMKKTQIVHHAVCEIEVWEQRIPDTNEYVWKKALTAGHYALGVSVALEVQSVMPVW
jgi:hypothetical protein